MGTAWGCQARGHQQSDTGPGVVAVTVTKGSGCVQGGDWPNTLSEALGLAWLFISWPSCPLWNSWAQGALRGKWHLNVLAASPPISPPRPPVPCPFLGHLKWTETPGSPSQLAQPAVGSLSSLGSRELGEYQPRSPRGAPVRKEPTGPRTPGCHASVFDFSVASQLLPGTTVALLGPTAHRPTKTGLAPVAPEVRSGVIALWVSK